MALSVEEIALLLDEARALLLGQRLGKIYHVEPDELYLTFRGGAERVYLFLSTRPRLGRFHLRWDAPPFPPRPSGFCEKLRAELSDKFLEDAVGLPKARAVRLYFRRCDWSIVGEFFGSRGNIILLEGDRLAESLWPVRRRGRTLRPGDRYQLGAEPDGGIARQNPRYLIAQDAAAGDADFPYSRAFAKLMAGKEIELAFARQRERLEIHLRRERKHEERLLANLSADRREAERADEYRAWGEALKCHLGEIRPGATALTVPDPFDGEKVLDIPLDPRRSPQGNLASLFQKYRKLKSGREVIEKRLEACSRAILALDGARERLEGFSWEREEDRAALEALANAFLSKPGAAGRGGGAGKRGGGAGRAKGPRATPALGPRRFEVKGHVLWVGRNARENASLIRRVARGNDFFLHVAGKPGAVVVVRPPPGREVASDVLGTAAMLAVFYSLGKDAGSQDVDYTRVKHVRPVGDTPGRFMLADRRTLRVAVAPDTLSATFAGLDPA